LLGVRASGEREIEGREPVPLGGCRHKGKQEDNADAGQHGRRLVLSHDSLLSKDNLRAAEMTDLEYCACFRFREHAISMGSAR
jgi:hypothetical protein